MRGSAGPPRPAEGNIGQQGYIDKWIFEPYLGVMDDKEPRDQRVPIMLTASELKAVESWRRSHEVMPSRSEACRQLILLGLRAETQRAARRGKR